MTTFCIHDSRFILDTRKHMTTYFIHDSRFILDTREHITTYFMHDSTCILDTREHMTTYFLLWFLFVDTFFVNILSNLLWSFLLPF
jgi:hypothetical protein